PRLAVNLHGRGPRSHRLLAGTRPDRMIGFACPAADFPDGPQWTPDEHEVRRWCRMLAGYQIAARPDDLLLHRPAVPAVAAGVTGIAHLATGYRTPSVLLFGPTPPAWWGPLVDPELHRVLWHGDLVAAPGRQPPREGWRRPHPALAAITVDEVLAAVDDLVAV